MSSDILIFDPNRIEWEIPSRVLHFSAAGMAAAMSSALYNPLDCLRVRWQVSTTSAEQNLWSFGSSIVKSEGLVEGLWRPGIGANAAGMAVSAAIRFGYYELVRDALVGDDEKSHHHMVMAGLMCGSLGYAVSTPFHYLKTLIQAEKGPLDAQGRYMSGARAGQEPLAINFWSGVEKVVRKGGLVSLYRGVVPLTSRGALFTAGQMMGYDGLKTMAKNHGYQDGPTLHILSSISASFGASLLSAPADLVMAKYMSSSSQSLAMCVHSIYQRHGISGFWRGWSIFFVRLTPVMLTFSTVYEQLRNNLGLGYFD